MKTFLKKIESINLFVKDVEKTAQTFAGRYGIGPWSIYIYNSNNIKDIEPTGMKTDDIAFKNAICRIKNTNINLIQPLASGNILHYFLKNKGQYLHSINYSTDSYQEAADFLDRKGFDRILGGSLYGRSSFVFFDTAKELKHIAGIIENNSCLYEFSECVNGICHPLKPEPSLIIPQQTSQHNMMQPVFEKIAQASFIVRNLDDMVKKYNDEYGIGPWRIWEFGPDTVNDMMIGGKRQDYRMRLALAKIGDIDLELIQPHDEFSIYADFLKKNGEGFHHLAYEVKDFNSLMDYMKKINIEVSMSGVWCGKHTWVYLTTENDLKHIVELNYTEPGFIYPEPAALYPPG